MASKNHQYTQSPQDYQNDQDDEDEISFVKVSDSMVMLHNRPAQLPCFDPKKQTWRLIRKQIFGMSMTLILLATYVGILRGYEERGPVTDQDKNIYNTLSTATLIALGLNFLGVFKTVAKVLRWWLLCDRTLDVRQIDLILGADSLGNVIKLLFKPPYKLVIIVICLVWLIANLGAQVVVAVIQLNASMNGGYNSSGTTNASSNAVLVPQLDFLCSTVVGGQCEESANLAYPSVAHTYGEGSRQQDDSCDCDYTGDALAIGGRQCCSYFRRTDQPNQPEFAVRFADYAPDDASLAYPYVDTGRILTVSASNCRSMGVTVSSFRDGWDGPQSEIEYTFPPGPLGATEISIPRVSLAADSTTYVWNGTEFPSIGQFQSCGSRCIYLYALRDFYDNAGTHNLTTYTCEISVSNVSNHGDIAQHMVNDSVALTAAASIALTGRWRFLRLNGTSTLPGGPPDDWREFQLYQEGADWAASRNDTANDVGAHMAEFAAAAIGGMAQRNPRSEVEGTLPTLGNTLNVVWENVAALAATIAAAHLLLVGMMLFLSRSVVVPDDSYMLVARLLRKTARRGDEVVRLNDEAGKEWTDAPENSKKMKIRKGSSNEVSN